jgi:hypothetical protein
VVTLPTDELAPGHVVFGTIKCIEAMVDVREAEDLESAAEGV